LWTGPRLVTHNTESGSLAFRAAGHTEGTTMPKTKRVVLVQPRSTGGNFEYVAIPRQGMLFLSAALENWSKRDGAPYRYEREIWFEDRSGKIDPEKDLADADILLVTALINETPR